MVRQRLDRGPSEHHEGPQVLKPAGGGALEGGGGAIILFCVLLSGDPESPPFWGGYMGFV